MGGFFYNFLPLPPLPSGEKNARNGTKNLRYYQKEKNCFDKCVE